MNENTKQIVALADGYRSSTEIADTVGLSPRYIRKVMKRLSLPRLPEGAKRGERNHQWKTGRSIDADGYVSIPAPDGHPCARTIGRILEHRHVMEQTLGRYLRPEEVVDHIDGLTLHNDPENLRLFPSNGAHLAATATGLRNWSAAGYRNIGARTDLGREIQRVSRYDQMKASGDVRLRQILLAALKLGTDSPFLLGTTPHTMKAGTDLTSRSTIQRALDDLSARWA